MNNDGVIDLKEMAVIIEMMDNLDGVIPGLALIRVIHNNPQKLL